jgi:ATP-binding cassette subfamily B protein
VRGVIAELVAVMRISWRVAPGYALLATLLKPAAVVSVTGTAIAQRALVDLRPGDTAYQVVVLAVGGGIVFAAWLTLSRLQQLLRTLVIDHTVPELRARTLGLIDARAEFEDLGSPEYADKLEIFRRDAYRTGQFVWDLYDLAAILVGLAITVWLLVSVDVRLIVVTIAVALSLVVSFFAARRSVTETHSLAALRREERYLHESCVLPKSVQETRAYAAEGYLDRKANDLWRTIARRTLRTRLIDSIWSGASMILVGGALIYGVVLLHAGVHSGHNTVGDVVLLVTLTIGMRGQLQWMLQQMSSIALGYSSATALAFIRSRVDTRKPPPMRARTRLHQGIEVRDLSFAYAGSGATSLRAVDLTIPKGTVLAIVGRNGAGKSTLANLLLGILTPTTGQILIDGEPLSHHEWRLAGSGAFQDFMKPPLALREVVGLGEIEAIHDDDRLRDALHAAGGTRLVESLPAGLDTRLADHDGTNLSHGQWQTLALARSEMRSDPLLIVLDEPSSALDAHAEHELFTSFIARGRQAGTQRGTISAVISHRYSAAYLADHIVVVENGQVLEHGTHAELMARKGEYHAMYEMQRKAYLT